MKNKMKITVGFTAIATFAVALTVNALSLGGYNGPVTLQLENGVASGTRYSGLTSGNNYGGTSWTTANADALDNLTGTSTHSQNDGTLAGLKGSSPSEDTFGIGEVTSIYKGYGTDPSDEIYVAGTGNPEIFGIFYGSEDFYIERTTATQEIFAAGMRIDFYENPNGSFASATDDGGTSTGYAQGTDARSDTAPTGTPDGDEYNGISNITDGNLLWSTISVPGFVGGGVVDDATFHASFNPSGQSGSGTVYTEVGTTEGGTGSQNDMIDFDAWTVSAGALAGTTADLKIKFASDSDTVPGDWALHLDDDIKGMYAPEPAAILLAFLAAPIAAVAQVLRRRQKKA